jgi:TolB-like protein
MGLVSELRRRNVIKVAVAYAVVAWLLIQVADTTFPILKLPEWSVTLVTALLLIGFPMALIFAWAFELTPEGIKLERHVDRSQSITHLTGRKLDYVIIAVLALALGYFAFDKFVLDTSRDAELVRTTAETVTEQVAKTATVDKSIAVLPFADMSPDGDQEYFSDGISEELLNLLSRLPGLRVVARTSSFQFKGESRDIVDIGQQLNVAHILEGSVRKSDNKLRITAQLIKADDGFHLWSESYDRELDDIFAVQEEIAAAIIDVLKVKLLLDPATGETAQPTVIQATNPAAYDAYLQGRELIRLRDRQDIEEAVRHLERSLRLDERFAPAHAQLAIAYLLLRDKASSGKLTLEEVRRRAIPHLDRADELEPNLAEVHAGRSLLAAVAGDNESAIEYAQKALAVNPSYIDAMNWLQKSLYNLGRYEEVEATFKQMLVTDPLTPIGRNNYSWWLRLQGRVEEARELADQLLAQNQRMGYNRHGEASLVDEGKIAEGLSWYLRAWAEDPGNRISSEFRVLAFIWVGEYDEARRADDILTYLVDVAEGRFDKAIRATQTRMQQYPDSELAISAAANVLYAAGRFAEALTLYERSLGFRPDGRPLDFSQALDFIETEMTMRLAQTRRKAGDEDGAQAAVRIARQDHAARRAAGFKNQHEYRAEAMIAAFEHDPEGVIAALKTAIQHGLRDPHFFADPIFEDLWDEPRFVALQQELDTILAAEHDKVLQLICFNNPVSGDWQPLPETCEGVEEQQVL